MVHICVRRSNNTMLTTSKLNLPSTTEIDAEDAEVKAAPHKLAKTLCGSGV